MANEEYRSESEESKTPLYQRPDVLERARTDERLAQQLHGLELADRGRAISQEVYAQMEHALNEHLRANHPDLFPPSTENS